jgi:hypothetical protein
MKKLIRLIAEAKELEDCKMILQLVVEEEKLVAQDHFGYQNEEGDIYPLILYAPDSTHEVMQKWNLVRVAILLPRPIYLPSASSSVSISR